MPLPNTGNVAAATYLGYATYEVRKAKGMYYMRQNEDSAYIQDNIHMTNRLTVNLGLRWQFSPYPYDKYNIMSSFDLKNMAIVLGQDLNTMYKVGATTPSLIGVLQGYGAKFETAKEAGLPSKLVHDNWHDIGPHLGFAYRAFEGKKAFVVRGGYSAQLQRDSDLGLERPHAPQLAVRRVLPELRARPPPTSLRTDSATTAWFRPRRSLRARTAPTR